MPKWSGTHARTALLAALLAATAACDDDPSGPDFLNAPANVSASVDGTSVQLSWAAVPGAESYTVQRQAYGGAGDFATVAANLTQTQYADPAVEARGTYLYRVLANAGSVQSEASMARAVRVCPQGVLCGTVPPGDSLVLAAGTYRMQGALVVDSGAVLRIAPGTTILGDTAVRPTYLLVRQGGQIFAEGTAQQPIVFTSARAPGTRQRGDWGGIVIAGRSTCNFPAPCQVEGANARYGGSVLNDNSGVLRYVRVEFAGFEVTPGNELNALTLAGVGSGTTVEYVQVHHGSDDGIEWFGGTVDVKYALATGNDDDSFDYSSGWAGRGQFWIVQQAENAGDKGFEVDGNETNFAATPLTDPRIYNVTLIGRGTSASSGNDAIQLRRGVRGGILNAIALGWGGSVLDVDDPATADHCTGGRTLIDNVLWFQTTGGFADNDADDFEAACAGSEIRNAAPLLVDATSRTAPDFRPAAGSPALTGAAAVPSEPFFTPVSYRGAVAPTGTPWYQGWTTFAGS